MPVVARVRDKYSCPAHHRGIIIMGYPRVLICHQPVARKGDEVLCKGAVVDHIAEGDETVLIGGKPIARKGDHTGHGGVIISGCPRVRIGRVRKALCKIRAANGRAPFITYTAGRPAPFISGK